MSRGLGPALLGDMIAGKCGQPQPVPRYELENMASCALDDLEAINQEDESRVRSMKERAPPIGSNCDRKDRWNIVIKGLWQFSEHNNLGEARGILGCLRHAARDQQVVGKRLLCITDSLVCLGLFAKGRTSSRGLLRLARQGAAYQLGLRVVLYLRFVESARNLADGPSRQSRLG